MINNELYNKDVASIFYELVRNYGVQMQDLEKCEIVVLAYAAKELTANKPQQF